MMKNSGKIFILILLLTGSNIKAQESGYGSWFIYVGTGYFGEKWSLFTEAQYRDYGFFNEFETFCFRIAGQYDVHKNLNFSLGYSHFISQPVVEGELITRHEYRPYQQMLIRNKYGRVYFNHRYRFEQRIFEDDFRLRFRYFFQTFIVLNKRKLEKNAFYLSGYAEVFLNFEKPVFDRVRLYAGLGYQISNTIRMEIGNMAQVWETQSRNQLNIFLVHNFKYKN